MEWDRKDDDVTKQQLKIVQMWRWSKTIINRIATKFKIQVSMVSVAIKKFKHKAKRWWEEIKCVLIKERLLGTNE